MANCGWLKVLKNSVRNNSVWPSRIPRNDLERDISQLYSPGPRILPKATLPKPEPPPIPLIAPTVGLGQNAAELNQPSLPLKPLVTRSVTLPDVAILA